MMSPLVPLSSEAKEEIRHKRKRVIEDDTEEETEVEGTDAPSDLSNLYGYEDAPVGEAYRTDDEDIISGFLE